MGKSRKLNQQNEQRIREAEKLFDRVETKIDILLLSITDQNFMKKFKRLCKRNNIG